MSSSKTSIYSALGANLLIALTKFVAGGISNSASMIAEGIHSMVDTMNQLLLLLGISRSKKPADQQHPFGYGKELYFWSFIVSILIFGLGGGISIYQGISHMLHPVKLGDPSVSYIVLGLSICFEGFSLWVAVKAFNRIRGDQGWWRAIVKSKDPSTFLVLFEDAAAVCGLFIVLICLYLEHRLNLPFLDGLASLLVGLLLVVVSAILARESRSLLMGEGLDREARDRICRMVQNHPSVQKSARILSTYQSPEEVVLMMSVIFDPQLSGKAITDSITEIRELIKAANPMVRNVIIQPDPKPPGIPSSFKKTEF